MPEPRNAWDDVRDLMARCGHEARFEPAPVKWDRPPIVPGPTYGFAGSPDLLFTEPEGEDD